MNFQNNEMKFMSGVLKAKFINFALIISVSLLSSCGYIESRSFKTALEQKNCLEAKNILLKSLKKDLNNDHAKYNLIHSFACAGDLDSANKQIDALLNEGSKYKYELYFLKGYILGEMGDIDEALMAYQNALDINADVKIKQNIELLLKDQQSGKSGKKKKGKNKKQKDSDPSDDQNDPNQDPEDQKQQNKDKKSSGEDQKKESQKQPKKMTDKQVEKIMKEIDGDEKKIRSQGLKIKSKKGGQNNEKNW